MVIAQTPDLLQVRFDLLHAFTSKEFFEILGLTGGGWLIGLVAMLRGKKPRAVRPVDDKRVAVASESGATTVVHAQTVNLYQNYTVRDRLDGVVAPLWGTS